MMDQFSLRKIFLIVLLINLKLNLSKSQEVLKTKSSVNIEASQDFINTLNVDEQGILQENEDPLEENGRWLNGGLTYFARKRLEYLGYNNYLSFPGKECYRDCSKSKPRVCYFNFTMEEFHALGPVCKSCGLPIFERRDCFAEQCVTVDGNERGIMTINRQIPAPPIHVCKDDYIVADVTNMMGGTSASLHWHGIHQRLTPHYDGVPFVTQCPIPYSTSFRYAFYADVAGTQFYHSHSGHHKFNGHYGALVVRQPKTNDPNKDFYDFDLKEHVIIISDWMKTYGEMYMPGLRSSPLEPSNLLIHGKGRTYNESGAAITTSPLSVYQVQKGYRYRFRLINAMSHSCPARFEIEDHQLTVLSSDSFDFKPVVVDDIVSASGERFDFVINTNRPNDKFWIRIKAMGHCGLNRLQQYAILSYNTTAAPSELAFPTGPYPDFDINFNGSITINHPNETCTDTNVTNWCISDLRAYTTRPDLSAVPADYTFYIGFQSEVVGLDSIYKPNEYFKFLNIIGDVLALLHINNISLTFPSFPPLTQSEDIRKNSFCNDGKLPPHCKPGKLCHCTHVIKLKLNSIVELVVWDGATNINALAHPFHIHGFAPQVIKMAQNTERVSMTEAVARSMVEDHRAQRAKAKAAGPVEPIARPFKDTIGIPSAGYVHLRFKADNPGWWLLHCHFEWHLAVGMGLIFQVGEPEDMVKPPRDFPKCGNYRAKPSLF